MIQQCSKVGILARRINKDSAEAIAYETKWVESLPESHEKAANLQTLADIYHSAGDNKAAKRSYLDALRIDPDDAMCLGSLARVYAEEGNEQEAIGMFYRSASVVAKNISRARRPLGRFSNPEAEAW
jgi:tetratricopeptide (TPR) repeat protein